MKPKSVHINMLGMNNKTKSFAVPKDKARNAVNVVFDDSGNIKFPRPGKTSIYTGSGIHSLVEYQDQTLFVEDGTLKRLIGTNSAVALLAGVGNSEMHYTRIGSMVYFCNQDITGKVDANDSFTKPWGVARPPRQPDASVNNSGGLFAGTYRVAITWIGEEEGGTGNAKQIVVPDGGGINLSNFPTPPSYVVAIAVYVTEVNSKDLCLYAEYPANVANVSIGRLNPEGVTPTIPLRTQFKFPPRPQSLILAHYGRIYYLVGDKVYWTDAHRFGQQSRGSYKRFNSKVQVLVSCPGVLYAGTETSLGKITNIDGDGGAAFEELQLCGGVKGTECYDNDGVSAYFMSHRGWIKATPEGLEELTFNEVAIPKFNKGCATVIEHDGVRYLVGSFRGGSQNSLSDSKYNLSEIARGSL